MKDPDHLNRTLATIAIPALVLFFIFVIWRIRKNEAEYHESRRQAEEYSAQVKRVLGEK
jgi:hypothetical protein